jgi:hypothetical protein
MTELKRVRMVIHQPRLGIVSEWTQTVDALNLFKEEVKQASAACDAPDAPLVPGNDQCKFCRGKAQCGALRTEVLGMFEVIEPADRDVGQLALAMSKADMIEAWLKAIRGQLESMLFQGQKVPGWKIVQGKQGNRKWVSDAQAEEVLKAMRVKHDQMYDYSVISPTTAEKLMKAEVIGPRQWPKLQSLITRTEGKPSVAPESDKRPAISVEATADAFDDLTVSQPVLTTE